MESYCLKCKKNTENIDPEVSSSINCRVMILSNCAVCGNKKKTRSKRTIEQIMY